MASDERNGDIPVYASPSTKMLERRRQMIEAEVQLNKQQEIYSIKNAELDQRESRLQAKDKSFQEHLCRFARFLQDSDAKMARARARGQQEVRQQQAKDRDIRDVKDNIILLKDKQQNLVAELALHIKYQDYLESCVSDGGQFRDIGAIFLLHTTLTAEREKLCALLRACSSASDANRAEFATSWQATRSRIEQLTAGIATMKAGKATADKPSSDRLAADAVASITTSWLATVNPEAIHSNSPAFKRDEIHGIGALNNQSAIAEEDDSHN